MAAEQAVTQATQPPVSPEVAAAGQAVVTKIIEKFPILEPIFKNQEMLTYIAIGGLSLAALLLIILIARRGRGSYEGSASYDRRIARLEVKVQDVHSLIAGFIGAAKEDLGFLKSELTDLRQVIDLGNYSERCDEAASQISSSLLNYIQANRDETHQLRKELAEMKALIEAIRTDRRQILEKLVEDNMAAASHANAVEKPKIAALIPDKPKPAAPPEAVVAHAVTVEEAPQPAPAVRRVAAQRSGNASFFLD